MPDLVRKFTVTPLDRTDWKLPESLPIQLGHGLSIQDYGGRIPSVSFWDEYLSKHDMETVNKWSVCLEHEYFGPPHMDGDENVKSTDLVVLAIACLRFLTPNTASGQHCLQIEEKAKGKLEAFNYQRPLSRAGMESVESLAPMLDQNDLSRYRGWISWIQDFAMNGATYLPLWISLNFSEKSCVEFYKPLKHGLRVMALEALFSDGVVYGRRAMRSRLLPLFDGIDLYVPYRSEFHSPPPLVVDEQLIGDVVQLRNDIAHGRGIPHAWLQTRSLNPANKSYLDDLTDAASAMLRLTWLHIFDNGLHTVFSDKTQMANYCTSGARISV